jgi:hypothetical protein
MLTIRAKLLTLTNMVDFNHSKMMKILINPDNWGLINNWVVV